MARLALGIGIVLMLAKFAAWLATGADTILSDAVESIVNVTASGLAMLSIWYAARPPDREHPYGHGRMEFLTAALEGGMLVLAGVLVAAQAIGSLWRGHAPITNLDLGMWVTVGCGVVNGVLAAMLWVTARRHESLALEADAKHLAADLVTSLVVVAALGMVHLTGMLWIDSVAAIGIGIALMLLGAGVVRRSVGRLLDAQEPADERALRAVLERHLGATGQPPQLCSYEKLRHRHDGARHWIDVHLRVSGSLSVANGHAIASAIEHELVAAVGGAGKATVHMEPCEDSGCLRCRRAG